MALPSREKQLSIDYDNVFVLAWLHAANIVSVVGGTWTIWHIPMLMTALA